MVGVTAGQQGGVGRSESLGLPGRLAGQSKGAEACGGRWKGLSQGLTWGGRRGAGRREGRVVAKNDGSASSEEPEEEPEANRPAGRGGSPYRPWQGFLELLRELIRNEEESVRAVRLLRAVMITAVLALAVVVAIFAILLIVVIIIAAHEMRGVPIVVTIPAGIVVTTTTVYATGSAARRIIKAVKGR